MESRAVARFGVDRSDDLRGRCPDTEHLAVPKATCFVVAVVVMVKRLSLAATRCVRTVNADAHHLLENSVTMLISKSINNRFGSADPLDTFRPIAAALTLLFIFCVAQIVPDPVTGAPLPQTDVDHATGGTPQVAADLVVVSGEEYTRWHRRLKIDNADSGTVQAAVFNGDSYYLAGKKWNKESNQQSLWIWKVDSQGQKVWEREFDAKQSPEVIELLPTVAGSSDDQTSKGVRLVYSSAMGTKTQISHVSADGEINAPVALPWPDETSGVIELADGDLLLFGATMLDIRKTMQGWVARTSPSGDVRWKREITPDDSVAGKDTQGSDAPNATKGYYQRTVLDSGVELADQSLVLVGQSGNYSKFGVGDSMLWILQLASNGEQIAQASVDGAYSPQMVRQPIVLDATGFAVRHWKFTVNNENPDLTTTNQAKTALWPWLSRFDQQLQLVDEGDMRTHLPPDAITIGDWRPGLFPLSIGKSVLIRWSDKEGKEKQRVEIGSPGQIAPLITVTGNDGILSVNNYRDTALTSTENPPQVLLILLNPPQ